jgi:hypothetical protein
MVLDHQSTQATHTRHPHFRDIRLLAGPGRGGRVHVKVHVDGSPEQPGAVSLPAGFTGDGFLEQHQRGEHRQYDDAENAGFSRNVHGHNPSCLIPSEIAPPSPQAGCRTRN